MKYITTLDIEKDGDSAYISLSEGTSNWFAFRVNTDDIGNTLRSIDFFTAFKEKLEEILIEKEKEND